MESMNVATLCAGDVILVDRGLYKHYGVYCGGDEVIHFAADGENELCASKAFVQQTTLKDFAQNGKIERERLNSQAFSPAETVNRARSCLGTKKGEYNLVFNNCEHFANWCKYGKHHSGQVSRVASEVYSIVEDSSDGTVATIAVALASVAIGHLVNKITE